jgi:pyrroloquinoline quinone biosynthesis protein D
MSDDWRPALAPSIVLRYDKTRETDLLVMPERVVVLNGGAAAIVGLCDGKRNVAEIVKELGEKFPDAPIGDDVPKFLERVREAGWVR